MKKKRFKRVVEHDREGLRLILWGIILLFGNFTIGLAIDSVALIFTSGITISILTYMIFNYKEERKVYWEEI